MGRLQIIYNQYQYYNFIAIRATNFDVATLYPVYMISGSTSTTIGVYYKHFKLIYTIIQIPYPGVHIYTNLPAAYDTQIPIVCRNRDNGYFYVFYTDTDFSTNLLYISIYRYCIINNNNQIVNIENNQKLQFAFCYIAR